MEEYRGIHFTEAGREAMRQLTACFRHFNERNREGYTTPKNAPTWWKKASNYETHLYRMQNEIRRPGRPYSHRTIVYDGPWWIGNLIKLLAIIIIAIFDGMSETDHPKEDRESAKAAFFEAIETSIQEALQEAVAA